MKMCQSTIIHLSDGPGVAGTGGASRAGGRSRQPSWQSVEAGGTMNG